MFLQLMPDQMIATLEGPVAEIARVSPSRMRERMADQFLYEKKPFAAYGYRAYMRSFGFGSMISGVLVKL